MKLFKTILYLFFLHHQAAAQNPALDSLQELLTRTKSDTARISIYVEKTYNAEDTSTVLYSDTAIRLINALLPASKGKTLTDLQRLSLIHNLMCIRDRITKQTLIIFKYTVKCELQRNARCHFPAFIKYLISDSIAHSIPPIAVLPAAWFECNFAFK